VIAGSDTSPLSYLALIGEGDLLASLFEEVWIPPAVAGELTHPGTPQAVRSWLEARPAWLRLAEAPDTTPLPVTPRLHIGEAEVIALGLALRPDFLLLDDRAARGVARGFGLPLMGTLASLEVGARDGHVDLPSALARLARTNFRASPELLRRLLPR
jgi:predicted nucleic acid-binding protein